MTDPILDELDFEIVAPVSRSEPGKELTRVDPDTGEVATSTAEQIDAVARAVIVQGADLLAILRSIELPRALEASPSERLALADLHQALRSMARDLGARASAVELTWKHAFEQLGARKLPLPDGRFVTYEPSTEYVVDGPTLRKELLTLVERGFLTTEEVDDAIAPVVTYKANHSKLNNFARRGTEVAEIIDSCRTKKESTNLSGRITFPSPKK